MNYRTINQVISGKLNKRSPHNYLILFKKNFCNNNNNTAFV